MPYAEMDKRTLLLPDLLGKPMMKTDENGNLIALADFEFPPNHYVLFYPIPKWDEILEIRGER